MKAKQHELLMKTLILSHFYCRAFFYWECSWAGIPK